MKKIIYLFTLLAFIVSCASINPSYGIISFGQTDTLTRNTLEGELKVETMVIVPIGGSFSNADKLGLKITRNSLNGEINSYALIAEYHGTDWAFVEGIRIKIDEKTYNFTDSNPSRNVRSGQYVTEKLWFDLTNKQVEDIRNADIIKAELLSRVVTIEGEELSRIKAFINE